MDREVLEELRVMSRPICMVSITSCVYKHNPGLYQRVFSRSFGDCWSSACGKGSPYFLTHKPADGQPCINCKRPIELRPGSYNILIDWEGDQEDLAKRNEGGSERDRREDLPLQEV
jgi:hypothetical protein